MMCRCILGEVAIRYLILCNSLSILFFQDCPARRQRSLSQKLKKNYLVRRTSVVEPHPLQPRAKTCPMRQQNYVVILSMKDVETQFPLPNISSRNVKYPNLVENPAFQTDSKTEYIQVDPVMFAYKIWELRSKTLNNQQTIPFNLPNQNMPLIALNRAKRLIRLSKNRWVAKTHIQRLEYWSWTKTVCLGYLISLYCMHTNVVYSFVVLGVVWNLSQ